MFRVRNFTGPFGIEIYVEHDLEQVSIGLDTGGFEAIHDDLAPSAHLFVVLPGKRGINDPEEVREQREPLHATREMDVIIH